MPLTAGFAVQHAIEMLFSKSAAAHSLIRLNGATATTGFRRGGCGGAR
jgi:hypothetical protein